MLQIQYWFEENRKKILIILGILLLIVLISIMSLGIHYIKLKEDKEKVEKFPIEEKVDMEIESEKEKERLITVDIKGAIEKPGVYEIEEGSRVQDVISLASGLKENADVSLINLSKKVEDEMVIIIYTREEILAFQKEKEEVLPTPNCPETTLINDACISNSQETGDTQVGQEKISINQGNLEQLMTLPGIGESKAQAIIQYREENGGFQTLEELKNVSGIGEAIFAKMEAYIIL